MKEEPSVQVVLTTFNHERYIANAIESVLRQKTRFPIRLLIAEDCSTDGTRAIVLDYATAHPGIIETFLPERNLGNFGNTLLLRALRMANAELVALLDGDDAWVSDEKLQNQVDFLRQHPDCALCWHDVWVIDERDRGARTSYAARGEPRFRTFRDLLSGCFLPFSSVMFRHQSTEFPGWFEEVVQTDWAIHLSTAERGSIGYIPEKLGMYRIHRGGVWSGMSRNEQAHRMLHFYEQISDQLDLGDEPVVRRAIARWHAEAAAALASSGQEAAARHHLESLRLYGSLPPGLFLRLKLPALYAFLRWARRRVSGHSTIARFHHDDHASFEPSTLGCRCDD